MPTAIGDVVPALVSVFTTALAAEPTSVYSGPKPTAEHAKEYVCVAWDPEGGDSVTTAQDESDMGNRWIDEAGEVTCSVTCWTGDTDTAPLLARADDLLDICDASLVANPTLGGVLLAPYHARVLGRTALAQVGASTGVSVRLSFTVRYATLLT